MDGDIVEHEPKPIYLGVTLDRSLTYRFHIEKTTKKLQSHINVVRKLAGTKWGCRAKTLRITTTALVISTASYSAPVWMSSAHTHKIDVEINKALRIVCGAVDSTPVPWLYAISNITPHSIIREEAAIKECQRISANTGLPIVADIETAPTDLRLISRNPFWCFYRNARNMTDYKSRWREWWQNVSEANKDIITDPSHEISGQELPRHVWVKLNRIRTGHGCCAYMLHKWNFTDSPNCECGSIQTMEHIWRDCTIHRFNGSMADIHQATNEAIQWITNLGVDI